MTERTGWRSGERRERTGWARQGGPTRFVPAGVVTVLILSIGLLAVTVATQPARLDTAAPADQDRLSVPPAVVTLSFTARPDPGRVHVAVVDSAGAAVTSASQRVTGATVVQPVSIVDAGTYRVGYHVVFANGRELTGQLTFTVSGVPTGPAAGPAPPPDIAAGPVLPPDVAAGPVLPPVDLAGAAHAHGAAADPLTVVVLGADAAVVIAALLFAGWRRRSRSSRTI